MSASASVVFLVAAASVSQIIQFTFNIFVNSHTTSPAQAQLSTPSTSAEDVHVCTPLEDVRYCVLPEAPPPTSPTPCTPVIQDTGLLGDPYERELVIGSSGISLLLGACFSALTGLHRCCRTTQEVVAIVNHGRGAELQNQRVGGRGRLSIAAAGPLGNALV